ncbi:hypothetical protein K7432_016807 [Basidiobolus ranarum]|uniref:Nucleoporin Nup133/Nup155-like C-terminal domain-containing protein n=1 Tax=Basidiobolus ranarum TaxID=34480 RepID=A0ABR2WE78_9FUNG
MFVKQRPIDILNQLLTSPSTQETDILAFIENYGRAQVCAMCLAIICGHPSVNSSGFDSLMSSQIGKNQSSISSAQKVFFEYGGKPILVDYQSNIVSSNDVGRPLFTPEPIYSGRHDGLALFLARLVNPIWKKPFIVKVGNEYDTAVSVSVLSSIQQNLASLREFLEANPHFTSRPDSSQFMFSDLQTGRREAEAWQMEQQSLYTMQELLTQCFEAISFISLLLDYRLSDIIHNVTTSTQDQLLELTFENFLISVKGRELRRDLVAAVIDKQANQHISVEAVSDLLQKRCGSFCTVDDVTLFKAIEHLRHAKATNEPEERSALLRESLRLFNRVAKHLPLIKLQEICEEFKRLRFHMGAVELGLTCAKEQDPAGYAISFFQDNAPSSDFRVEFYKKRIRCYECVFSTLLAANSLYQQTKLSAEDSEVALEDNEIFRNQVFHKALSSDDVLFHFQLYDWYIAQGLVQQLLEVQTPYLEDYLQREPLTLEKLDLLWQYYVRAGHYGLAARVQSRLADSTEFELTLAGRIEYLSRAVGNAKSFAPGISREDGIQFLHELEEKLEVAQVQMDIYHGIKRSGAHLDALAELDTKLFDVTQLYNQFAFPLRLYESMLLIFYTSNYYDQEYIGQIWLEIIQQTHDNALAEGRVQPNQAMSQKVKDIGKKYYPSSNVFPLAKICDLLEKYNLQHNAEAEPGWVVRTLHDIGVPYGSMLEIFHSMFETKLPPWQSPSSMEFLLEEIYILMNEWITLDKQRNFSEDNESLPAKFIDESISKYLVTLATTNSTLVNKFHELQRRIRQLY